METPAPRARARHVVVLRVLAATLVVAVALVAFVSVRRAREEAGLALAAERLAAGDEAGAVHALGTHEDGRARAGRALAAALSGEGPEGCDCSAGDLAIFHPSLVVEEALRRGEREGALRAARLAAGAGDPRAGVTLAAALVEVGRDGEARAALASVPEADRLAGPGRETARVLDLRERGAACIVRDRGRRLAGVLDATGHFQAVPETSALVPAAAAPALAAAEKAPSLHLAIDLELSRLALAALGSYRGSVVLLDLASGGVLVAVSDPRTVAAGGTPAFEQRREPASIAKIVTTAAALRAGIDPDAEIARMTCEGFARYGNGTLWCASPGGKLRGLAHALAISCNVAFANVGLKVGQPALVQEFRRWGFDGGEPGDGRIVQPPHGELPLAKMAVGLDATDITPLHAARLAAVTAEGEMPQPRLVAATDGVLGLAPRVLPHAAGRRLLEAPAAEMLRHAMEAVTQPGGTAGGVAPAGFPVAMKTGTASAPGVGYHVNYVGVGPLPRPTVAFCVRVTGQPTSVHVSRAAREVLSSLLQSLALTSFARGR
jgi:peptidoglycan glycosyltransferase